MTKYKYEVVYSNKFKKSLKKELKQGKDIKKLKPIIDSLAAKEELDLKYKNHKLINDKYYYDCFECHIEPDWLLIYQYNDKELILLLVDTGSHSNMFGLI